MSAESIAEMVFRVMEEQIALLPNPPTVKRNQAWANRLKELPLVSLYLEADERVAGDFDTESIVNYKDKTMTIRMELTVAKKQGESVTWTLYHIVDGVSRRLEEQLSVMREQAPMLVHVDEGDLSEVEMSADFQHEVARADKTYYARYRQPRY